ncbi:MAG TPA: hypothetical protein VH208_00435 [Myxococcaceae bacterium]|jgi:hypothetical protein|nr:hypothetical protein [Myxococcaceae bacterium]
MRGWAALGLLAAGACSRAPSATDARELLKVLTVATRVEGEDTRTRLLLRGCSEISSCAAGCQKALSAVADPSIDASQRATILAECFDELKAKHPKSPADADAWFRGYLARYAERAGPKLALPEQRQLEAARMRLQIVEN